MHLRIETAEDYTGKDLAHDLAVITARNMAAYAVAMGVLLTAGYIYGKHLERKDKKNAKN
jgi:hypothetical protein